MSTRSRPHPAEQRSLEVLPKRSHLSPNLVHSRHTATFLSSLPLPLPRPPRPAPLNPPPTPSTGVAAPALSQISPGIPHKDVLCFLPRSSLSPWSPLRKNTLWLFVIHTAAVLTAWLWVEDNSRLQPFSYFSPLWLPILPTPIPQHTPFLFSLDTSTAVFH